MLGGILKSLGGSGAPQSLRLERVGEAILVSNGTIAFITLVTVLSHSLPFYLYNRLSDNASNRTCIENSVDLVLS